MSRLVRSLPFPSLAALLVTLALLVAALAIGPLVQILRVGVREVVILALIILMSLLLLIPSERVLRFGFTLWILTFAFGWRTVYLTPNLNIHPAEVLLVLLFFAMVGRAVIQKTTLDLSLPIVVPFFLLFGAFGIYVALSAGRVLDIVIEESKVFFAIPFVYYVVRWSIKSQQDWERAARWATAVAVYISCLGLLDYFFPSLSRALSAREDIPTTFLSQSYQGASFTRVGFVFFGNFAAGFVVFTFAGFSFYYVLRDLRTLTDAPRRILMILFLALELGGIYLSGYRGLWYAVAFFIAVYTIFQRRALGLIAAGSLILPLLPIDFFNRFQSVFNTQFADSSQYDRIFRATRAYNMILQAPLTGVGWGGSGYVHSDFIQITANLGLFGIALFLLWIAGILWRLFYLTRRTNWVKEYARILFASICGLLVSLSGEGLIIFVQLIFPIWFLFAMSARLFELANQADAPAISPPL